MYRWLHQGCYAQVTALSILGRFDRRAESRRGVARRGRIHSSRATPNLQGRPLQLRAAYDKVAERRGDAVAQALFQDNPLAAFEGRSLPTSRNKPTHLPSPPQYRRRKRFIFF